MPGAYSHEEHETKELERLRREQAQKDKQARKEARLKRKMEVQGLDIGDAEEGSDTDEARAPPSQSQTRCADCCVLHSW